MAKTFEIIPMTAPHGSDDYLPCDEAHATHWGVVIDENAKAVFETREEAEDHALRISRAARFTWFDGDVDHH